ncbi:MAG: uL22 family ribosomal protein [Candidatus Aenigmatarchaeota archaeon]
MYSRDVTGNTAKALNRNARVSTSSSKVVCKAIRGMDVLKAKKFLEDIKARKKSINGRYYTKITEELLVLISSAEKNAEFKNLDLNNTFIAHVAPLKGATMRRRRHKNKIGSRLKATHLEVILKERPIPGAEKKIPEKKVSAEKKPGAAAEKEKAAGKAPETAAGVTKKEETKAGAVEEVKEAIKETVRAEVQKKKAEAGKEPVKEAPKKTTKEKPAPHTEKQKETTKPADKAKAAKGAEKK